MKNCERKEYQLQIIKAMHSGDCKDCPMYEDKECIHHCEGSLLKDMNSEYWEPWELQAMKNISDTDIKKLRRIAGISCIDQNGECIGKCPVDFPSLKIKEEIDIDEQLKANGMHR